ncbi:MAG: hypothetical protein P0116_11205 [Candidatus Nitrosocosmicus sp.]|nr:hypothetical protein [Candidatus Nitrosocosmicus sp.]
MTTTANKINNTAAGTVVFNGTLGIPMNMDSLRLNFESQLKSTSTISNNQTINPVKSIDLIPTSQKAVYSEDYENATNPYELFGDELYSALSNPDNPISNISLSSVDSISGNNSLRVDMKMMDKSDDPDDWSYIITDYIPIDDNINLKFNSKVKTMNVIDFHPMVYYYDSNYTQLGENVIVEKMDGSFEKQYDYDIVPPRNTEFIQIAFLFLPNANSKSSFLLDDSEVTEIVPSIHMDNLGDTDAYFTDMSSGHYADNTTADNLSLSSSSVQTKSIPIVNNASYTYTIDVDDENIDSIKSYALFRESNGSAVEPDSNTISIDGETNVLNPVIDTLSDTGTGYILQKNIDIIKNGTYAFDFQFYNNDTRTLEDKPIKLMIDGVERDYQSLSGNDSDLYSNLDSSSYNTFSIVSTAYLQKGTHNIELTVPDSKAKLDFALVYTIKTLPHTTHFQLFLLHTYKREHIT